MQVFHLPRDVNRGAGVALRLLDAQPDPVTAQRRELVCRWQQARADGLNASQAAAAVGVSCATLYRWYRWQRRPEPLSRQPHQRRQPTWSPQLITAVRELREDYPMWGKAKLTVVLNRDGRGVSESMVGRILKRRHAESRLRRWRHCLHRRCGQ